MTIKPEKNNTQINSNRHQNKPPNHLVDKYFQSFGSRNGKLFLSNSVPFFGNLVSDRFVFTVRCPKSFFSSIHSRKQNEVLLVIPSFGQSRIC